MEHNARHPAQCLDIVDDGGFAIKPLKHWEWWLVAWLATPVFHGLKQRALFTLHITAGADEYIQFERLSFAKDV